MSPDRRRFLCLTMAGAAASLAACTGGPGSGTFGQGKITLAPGTRLILVRHADRRDGDLSAKGRARAAALPAVLDDVPLDLILSPGIQRNIDTARPLAIARDMPITRISQERPAPQIAVLAAGKSAIWVGNKGNLKSIWEDLRLEGLPPLEYGELFIVSVSANGETRVDRRRWGST